MKKKRGLGGREREDREIDDITHIDGHTYSHAYIHDIIVIGQGKMVG